MEVPSSKEKGGGGRERRDKEARGEQGEGWEGFLILADICRATLSNCLSRTSGCLSRARCSRLCLDPGLDGAL